MRKFYTYSLWNGIVIKLQNKAQLSSCMLDRTAELIEE